MLRARFGREPGHFIAPPRRMPRLKQPPTSVAGEIMKAYELQKNEGFDALTKVEREAPRLGPGEVRVHVRAVSLNFRDLMIARSAKGGRNAPIVPTSDGAGEVVEVGSGVTRLRVGDRVAANFFPTWIDGPSQPRYHAAALGGSTDGMLAEEVVLSETAWVKLPEHLSFEEGATLPCAAVTAYNALFESASLRPGDTVLVQGTGGVSIFALQLAKAAGARVIATSKSAEKRARAQKLGADHTIDYQATPKWGSAAREWTGGRGVDVVVEVGGPGTFDQSVAALRYEGTMSLLGVLTGTRGEVNTYDLFQKAVRVYGVYVGSVAMFESLNRALTAHRIKPVVDRVFPFEQARAAYEHLASGQHFGKVVIKLD
jgi:NADPH:quinone reductase-like Zn-dependent oxidoreductase